MATMHPMRVPGHIRSEPKRSGEMAVFDALESQLPDAYQVYYSSPWIERADGREMDGECDFLVAHRDLGILAIEVKGGRVAVDDQNEWVSTDRKGFARKIKNPVEQARSAKHALLRKLRAVHDEWVVTRHGVILPHSQRPRDGRDLRPDAPLGIFAFDTDMGFLAEWVEARFHTAEEPPGGGGAQTGLGDRGLAALHRMLARPVQFDASVRAYLDADLKNIDTLTASQFRILRSLGTARRVAIPGAAGTGKTALALEKATRLADDDQRVLVLCYNAPLGRRFTRLFQENPLVWAGTFHGFCASVEGHLARTEGREPRDIGSCTAEGLADILVEGLGARDAGRFDALIVDEGQDLHACWYDALECALVGGSAAVIYVFHDDNQLVRDGAVDFTGRLGTIDFRLDENLRNTKRIFETMEPFYRHGAGVTAIGPDGEPVRWITCDGCDTARRVITERIGDLTSNRGVRSPEIAVLVPRQTDLAWLATTGRLAGFKVVDANGDPGPDSIVVDSVRRFKGLESTAVIGYVDEQAGHDADLMYTLLSRGRAYLEICGPASVLERLRGPADRRG